MMALAEYNCVSSLILEPCVNPGSYNDRVFFISRPEVVRGSDFLEVGTMIVYTIIVCWTKVKLNVSIWT